MKRTQYSREKLPVGTVKVRTRGRRRYKVRMIKIRLDGLKSRRWINYARWWWEKNRGPIPAGFRVCHLDGDSMNDDPGNLGLLTPGDVVYLFHERDPEGSRRNYEKCRAGTAEWNRIRGRINRLFNWLPTMWYPVFPERGVICNDPYRSRRLLLIAWGVDLPLAGNGVLPRDLELPFLPVRGVELPTTQYEAFKKKTRVDFCRNQ